MKSHFFALVFAFGTVAGFAEANTATMIEKALPYLVDEGEWWMEEKGCASCHHTALFVWTQNLAAQQGFDVDLQRLASWNRWVLDDLLTANPASKEGFQKVEQNVEGGSQLILGRPTGAPVSQELAWLMKHRQLPKGSWNPNGQLPQQKRPLEETREVTTMWVGLSFGELEDSSAEIAKSAKFLKLKPDEVKSTEWFAVRIPFLGKTGADKEVQQAAIQDLTSRQNKDGGWSWVEGDSSDAAGDRERHFWIVRRRHVAKSRSH